MSDMRGDTIPGHNIADRGDNVSEHGPPSSDSMIDVVDLWRRYGSPEKGFDAVRGISFSVARGEVFALLGTNGAGKTSTLELLEGLAQPTGGTIRAFGDHDPYHDRKQIRPRTGVMLQESGFASDLTVTEIVRMWARCTTRARAVDDAIADAGLAGRADTLVKSLSGGEKRRLDLAVALLGSPELLFLDEPTSGIDPEGRRDIHDVIEALRAQGATIVLSTHYLEEAEQLADRLAIMHKGRIAVSGTAREIVAAYPSSLSFRLPRGLGLVDLPATIGKHVVHREETGDVVRLTTNDLQHTTTEALLWARDGNITLADLHARPASLEQAFLRVAQSDTTEEDASA